MTTSELEKIFVAFREQCIWLRRCYDMYCALYESNDRTKKILTASALWFFHELNIILTEYFPLQVCKITDPAETAAGRKNLTVDGLNIELRERGLMTEEISEYSASLSRYRELVKEPRNKIIGHLDLETVLNDVPIGGHKKEDVIEFFENLQGYCNAVGIAVGVGPSDFRTTSGPGDALDLIKVLKRGISHPESGQ